MASREKFFYATYDPKILSQPHKSNGIELKSMENSNRKQWEWPNRKNFKIPLTNLATLGIRPALATQAYPLNGRIVVGFLFLGCAISGTFVFVFYDAKTFAEYVQSIYLGSFAILFILSLLNTILQIGNLFGYIHSCDAIVNTSKSVTINLLLSQYSWMIFCYFEFFLYYFQN